MLEREREKRREGRGERGESREEVARTLVSCIPEAALSSRPGEKDEKKRWIPCIDSVVLDNVGKTNKFT